MPTYHNRKGLNGLGTDPTNTTTTAAEFNAKDPMQNSAIVTGEYIITTAMAKCPAGVFDKVSTSQALAHYKQNLQHMTSPATALTDAINWVCQMSPAASTTTSPVTPTPTGTPGTQAIVATPAWQSYLTPTNIAIGVGIIAVIYLIGKMVNK